MDGVLRMEEVNALGNEHFVWIFNNIVESYPQAVIAICNQRPFISADHLADAVSNYLQLLPPHGNNLNYNLEFCLYQLIAVTFWLNKCFKLNSVGEFFEKLVLYYFNQSKHYSITWNSNVLYYGLHHKCPTWDSARCSLK
jgi:hypothetical protein